MLWFKKKYSLDELFVLFIYTEADNKKTYKLSSFKVTTLKNLKGKLFGSPNHVVCLDGSSYPMSTFSHIAALDGKSLLATIEDPSSLKKKKYTFEEVMVIERSINESYFKKPADLPTNDPDIDVGDLF
jgi:hypothetical protein